jgi:hypothetical protein
MLKAPSCPCESMYSLLFFPQESTKAMNRKMQRLFGLGLFFYVDDDKNPLYSSSTNRLESKPRFTFYRRYALRAGCEAWHKPQRRINSSSTSDLKSKVQRVSTRKFFYLLKRECLQVVNMSVTFSVRIPRELKEKIEQNPADWSQEVRDFLNERIKQMELLKIIQELDNQPDKRKTKIDSATLIRQDRER